MALTTRTLPGHTCLGAGRHRQVFRRGRVVVKIPLNQQGDLDNWLEARRYQQYHQGKSKAVPLARCKLLPNGYLIMIYAEPLPYHECPSWADWVDCRQVGTTHQGKIVAYDYGNLPGEVAFGFLHLQLGDDPRPLGEHGVGAASPAFAIPVGDPFEGPVPPLGDVVGGSLDHGLLVLSPDGRMGQNPDGVVHVPFLVEGVPFRELSERAVDKLMGQLLQGHPWQVGGDGGQPDLSCPGLEGSRGSRSMVSIRQREDHSPWFCSVGPQGTFHKISDDRGPVFDECVPRTAEHLALKGTVRGHTRARV